MAENQDDHADAKAKMREALNKKKESEHAGPEGIARTGPIQGSEVTGAEGRRMFRRKSG